MNTPLALSSAQRAHNLLRDMILSGQLAAGTDHLESELAEKLNMSRTPVREACVMLESRGLLSLRPRKGVRILPVSPTDMEEIYDILTELETLAARKAAELRPAEHHLEVLSQAIDDMNRALAANDRETWATADHQFHHELMRLSGNRRAMEVFELLSDQVARARHMTLYMRPAPDQSNADHHAVLEAIRAGEPEIAATRHRQHRQYAKTMLLDLLKKYRLCVL